MVWAILKCQYWLRGIGHFTVYTDQIALHHLYSGTRELADFPEEIRNLAEATIRYNFNVEYVKGEKMCWQIISAGSPSTGMDSQ